MATRKLKIDGNVGAIAILDSTASDLAVSNPNNYLNKLYFHSDLNYSQIRAKASAATVNFSGLSRNYTTWDDGGKKGGCFITTACVKYNSELDNGQVLNTLRNFRDNYMLKRPDVADLVEYYYHMAPECVEKLENSKDPATAFNKLYTEYIIPAVDNINAGNNEIALSIYIDGIKTAINLAEQV